MVPLHTYCWILLNIYLYQKPIIYSRVKFLAKNSRPCWIPHSITVWRVNVSKTETFFSKGECSHPHIRGCNVSVYMCLEKEVHQPLPLEACTMIYVKYFVLETSMLMHCFVAVAACPDMMWFQVVRCLFDSNYIAIRLQKSEFLL